MEITKNYCSLIQVDWNAIKNLISFFDRFQANFCSFIQIAERRSHLTINNNKSLFLALSIINLTTINNETISHFFPRSPLSIFHRPSYLISRIIKMHHASRDSELSRSCHFFDDWLTFCSKETRSASSFKYQTVLSIHASQVFHLEQDKKDKTYCLHNFGNNVEAISHGAKSSIRDNWIIRTR